MPQRDEARRYRTVLAGFLITLLLPAPAGRSSSVVEVGHQPKPSIAFSLKAIEDYKATLQEHGESLDRQGILVETLDEQQTLASENADSLFNPASVMKLATSLTALSRFGPDHRYRTDVLANGYLDRKARRLEGDLVIVGACDPMFGLSDVQELGAQLSRLGATKVTGSLVIAGPFYYFATGYHSNLSPETSAQKLRENLRRSGINIDGPTVFGSPAGEILLSHYSERLASILLYQNAHSSNAIAEVVGESVGGPSAIQDFLIREVGLYPDEVYVGRASGLDVNQITPRAALRVLRALVSVLSAKGLKPEDVMPVAGVDSGTLRGRLAEEGIRGAVIAKTGTLVSIDNGVSTLVGLTRTRLQGTLLFAIFNSDGGVRAYRRSQDQLLEQVIREEGGGLPFAELEDRLANSDRDCYWQYVIESR
jgi:D-alanyl-D-alanine carboxypeptidase/D-alanyl-D-alanine-endopeptidase (penicillin-binding protein 4)